MAENDTSWVILPKPPDPAFVRCHREYIVNLNRDPRAHPRKARIDAPVALHQIIIRGIKRKAIFKDNLDRVIFFDRPGRIISETETGCYAWVLMRNHVRLL